MEKDTYNVTLSEWERSYLREHVISEIYRCLESGEAYDGELPRLKDLEAKLQVDHREV